MGRKKGDRFQIMNDFVKSLCKKLEQECKANSKKSELFSSSTSNIEVGKYYVIYNALGAIWVQDVTKVDHKRIHYNYLLVKSEGVWCIKKDYLSSAHCRHRLATRKEIKLFKEITKRYTLYDFN